MQHASHNPDTPATHFSNMSEIVHANISRPSGNCSATVEKENGWGGGDGKKKAGGGEEKEQTQNPKRTCFASLLLQAPDSLGNFKIVVLWQLYGWMWGTTETGGGRKMTKGKEQKWSRHTAQPRASPLLLPLRQPQGAL
jgi:hypothetical protein